MSAVHTDEAVQDDERPVGEVPPADLRALMETGRTDERRRR